MGRKSPDVPVKPEVFAWARESDGASVDEVAKWMNTDVETVLAIESGTTAPRIAQLRTLAQRYRRPLAVFLLDAPPVEPPLPTKFRRFMAQRGERQISRAARFAARHARNIQESARELASETNHRPRTALPGEVSLSDSPDDAASALRSRADITLDEQRGWADAYKAFRVWRESVEDHGVLCLQHRMAAEDPVGFVLLHDDPPVVVLNQAYSVRARVFAAVHEFGHVLLHRPGRQHDYEKAERWCNAFAGAALLPEADVATLWAEWVDRSGHEVSADALQFFTNRTQASNGVVLRRMHTLGIADRQTYSALNELLESRRAQARKKDATGGGPRQEVTKRAQFGDLYPSLVLESLRRGRLQELDAAGLLGIRVGNLDSLSDILYT